MRSGPCTATFNDLLCLRSKLLGFWTLSIVLYTRNYKTQRFGNWICFRPHVRGGTPTQRLRLALSKEPN
jgi:hypothetical protein